MAQTDTKETILDAAEALFGEQGFAATSLRQLTARAGVNLAAVNYHFGSKEDLARAVLLRYIAPVNAERMRRLDALPQPADVESVVRAFIEPVLQHGERTHGGDGKPDGACPMPRLFGRMTVEQPAFLRPFVEEHFGPVARRLVALLCEANLDLDATTAWWRLHFVIGAMAHTLQNAQLLGELSGGACAGASRDQILEQLIAFAVAGLRAREVA